MYKNNQMKIKLHMLLIGLVLIGGVNWGTTAFGYNLVEILSSTLNNSIFKYFSFKNSHIFSSLCSVILYDIFIFLFYPFYCITFYIKNNIFLI